MKRLVGLMMGGASMVLLVTASLSTPAVHAATIAVNTTADELNADGDCSLREAIQAANTDTAVDACAAGSGADTIVVPSGTFTLSIPGAGEDANVTGDLDITGDLTINGAGAATTIIQACDGAIVIGLAPASAATVSAAPCLGIDRVFHIPAAANVTVAGVTVRNGQANHGAGILNFAGNVNINNSTISTNSSPAGNLTSAIYSESGTTVLSDSIVSGNSPAGIGTGQGALTIARSTISGNFSVGSPFGGGVGTLTLVSTLTITDSTIANNSAPEGGVLNTGTGTITNSTIVGNTATGTFAAGGVDNGGATVGGGTLTITNSTVANNTSAGVAGGIQNRGGGTVNLKNTIVANSLSGSSCAGVITSLGHNLSSDASCAFAAAGDMNSTDPMLGALANNGGPTQTQALLAGSPAIDAGSSDCPPPAADQRGNPRPQDGDSNGSFICDIGAFEFGSGTPPTITPTVTATPIVTDTPTPTATNTATSTNTPMATTTQTTIATDTATATATNTATRTPTNTPTSTATPGGPGPRPRSGCSKETHKYSGTEHFAMTHGGKKIATLNVTMNWTVGYRPVFDITNECLKVITKVTKSKSITPNNTSSPMQFSVWETYVHYACRCDPDLPEGGGSLGAATTAVWEANWVDIKENKSLARDNHWYLFGKKFGLGLNPCSLMTIHADGTYQKNYNGYLFYPICTLNESS